MGDLDFSERELTPAYFLVRRILYFFPTLLAVVTITFLLIHLAPGDPAQFLVGQGGSPELYEFYREKFGLNRPLYEQFFIYMIRLAHGDLGYSLVFRRPVIDVITERASNTLLLTISAVTFALVTGTISGVISSTKPHSLRDKVLTVLSGLAYSIPNFWMGLIFILIFGVYVNILPLGGVASLELQPTLFHAAVDRLAHLILPTVTLGAFLFALISRYTKANMLEVLRADYITAARAKGLDERDVLLKHALRNAVLPTITLVGLIAPQLISGAVLVESLFSWPGLGGLLFSSLLFRDYPMLMGVFIVSAIAVVMANLATDIAYSFVDPRIRYEPVS